MLDEDLIRTKVSLIPESVAEIRVVDIVGLDKQADGGTHVRSTGEVGRIRVVKTESKGKGNKRIRIEVVRCADGPPRRSTACATGCASSDRVVVAFSGGADSAFLAWVAHDTLGRRPGAGRHRGVAVAAGRRARRVRRRWPPSGGCAGRRSRPTRWPTPPTPRNDGDRCYWCKDALMRGGRAAGRRPTGATVVLGVNLDDLGDHRPGQRAAAERGAAFPLVDAGFTKADVRAWSQRLGLRTWDKPAAACLASRLPYGTPVTLGRLATVERAEAALRRSGVPGAAGAPLRRHRPPRGAARPARRRGGATASAVVAAVQAAGYRYVTLDLEGLRSGNLNAALGLAARRRQASGPR